VEIKLQSEVYLLEKEEIFDFVEATGHFPPECLKKSPIA